MGAGCFPGPYNIVRPKPMNSQGLLIPASLYMLSHSTPSFPPGMPEAIERLLAFIAQDGCTDAQFEALALELFALQYAHNARYRRFCQRRGATPGRVQRWQEVPAVPISAFKETLLTGVPEAQCSHVFTTSGTSNAERKGRHLHPSIVVWDASMQRHFAQRFLAPLVTGSDAQRWPMLTLFPSQEELPHSSLARYLSQALALWGTSDSRTVVSQEGLDIEDFIHMLSRWQEGPAPVLLMGASFGFVHALDALQARSLRFRLPAGSRLLDTGGYKGRSRELPLDAFYDALSSAFGVARADCVNMYGMTELSSQFYDEGNAVLPSVKHAPHWVRTRVLDPLTGLEVPAGQTGLLAHHDLASFNAAAAILTEDLGIAVDGHRAFHLLGRAEGSAARGCSMALQAFLEASRA